MICGWLYVIVFLLSHGRTMSRFQLTCDVNRELCYTVYTDRQLNQTDAAEECRRQHVNGRLVTFESRPTQELVDEAIGLITSVSLDEYWIGARLRHLDKWTWVNGATYEDNHWLQFPNASRTQFGYVSLNKLWQRKLNTDGYEYSLRMNVIEQSDVPSIKDNSSQALCQRTMKGVKAYENKSATRWNEARNTCTKGDEWELVVLSDVHNVDIVVSDLMTRMEQNTQYFIGLSNVRLVWNIAGFQVEVASYTNWGPGAPHDFGNNSCVYASRKNNRQWFTSPCDTKRTFICVHDDGKGASADDRPTEEVTHSTEFNDARTSVATVVVGLMVAVIGLAIMCGLGAVFYLRKKSAPTCLQLKCLTQTNREISGSEDYVDDSQYAEIADAVFSSDSPRRTGYEVLYSQVNKKAEDQQDDSTSNASIQPSPGVGMDVVYSQVNKPAKTPTAESHQYANIQSPGGTSSTPETAAARVRDVSEDAGYANVKASTCLPDGNTVYDRY